MPETPRQRQVRQYEQDSAAARAQSARQRRREAKCKLVGHQPQAVGEAWETNATLYECVRCGEAWEEKGA